jgi:hypothetical protein
VDCGEFVDRDGEGGGDGVEECEHCDDGWGDAGVRGEWGDGGRGREHRCDWEDGGRFARLREQGGYSPRSLFSLDSAWYPSSHAPPFHLPLFPVVVLLAFIGMGLGVAQLGEGWMHWGAAVMDFSFVGELGLINTHVHTSQQLARGIADDVDLLTWLHGRIWPYESTMTDEDSYVSTLLCGVELIHSGVRHSDVFSMLGYHVASLEKVSSDGMLLWGCR